MKPKENVKYDIIGEAREGLMRVRTSEGAKAGTIYYLNPILKELLDCPPLAEATDFENGFARGVNSVTGSDILISHMRTIEGREDYINATQNLAKLVSANPQELLSLQQPLVLIDNKVFSFLLDVVRYRFLEQTKSKILNDDTKSASIYSTIDDKRWNHDINIKEYSNTIKDNFEKMKKAGMLSYNDLINYSIQINNLTQLSSYIPTAVNYALNKYYVDLVDCKTLGNNYNELNNIEFETRLANILPSNSIITKENINTLESKLKTIFPLSERLKQNSAYVTDIRDKVVAILKDCDESSIMISNRLPSDSTVDVGMAMQKFVISKYAQLKSLSENLLNKSTKEAPSLNSMVKGYKSAISRSTEKMTAVENYIAAYLGFGNFGEPENYLPHQPNKE